MVSINHLICYRLPKTRRTRMSFNRYEASESPCSFCETIETLYSKRGIACEKRGSRLRGTEYTWRTRANGKSFVVKCVASPTLFSSGVLSVYSEAKHRFLTLRWWSDRPKINFESGEVHSSGGLGRDQCPIALPGWHKNRGLTRRLFFW